MAEHDTVTEQTWQDFHAVVNMTGQELREWLLTDASGEDAFDNDPARPVSRTGEDIVNLLNKRRTDVTESDTELMREVTEFVRDQLADPRREDAQWRRRLMSVGHDPLKPDSARPDEEPDLEK